MGKKKGTGQKGIKRKVGMGRGSTGRRRGSKVCKGEAAKKKIAEKEGKRRVERRKM